jgi:hypothetical protein
MTVSKREVSIGLNRHGVVLLGLDRNRQSIVFPEPCVVGQHVGDRCSRRGRGEDLILVHPPGFRLSEALDDSPADDQKLL